MADTAQNDDNGGQVVLADVLDCLLEETDGKQVSVNDVVSAFEDRGFGALITVVGLVAAAPLIGAIPGMSILTGSLIILIAAQFIFGRSIPWIPPALANRSMSADTLKSGIEKSRPYAVWLDRFVKQRFDWLVRGIVQRRLIAIVVCALAATMVPLALVPWGVQAPATAIVLFGVAMIGRDGAFAMAGYSLVAVTGYVIYTFWDSISSALSALNIF